MKNIILILTLCFCINFVKASEKPPITIEYKYTVASDTLHLKEMKNDNDFCCNFVVVSSKADSTHSDVTLIKHTETGAVLGVIYGKASKKFILDICKQYGYLDKENVDRMANRIQNFKNNQ